MDGTDGADATLHAPTSRAERAASKTAPRASERTHNCLALGCSSLEPLGLRLDWDVGATCDRFMRLLSRPSRRHLSAIATQREPRVRDPFCRVCVCVCVVRVSCVGAVCRDRRRARYPATGVEGRVWPRAGRLRSSGRAVGRAQIRAVRRRRCEYNAKEVSTPLQTDHRLHSLVYCTSWHALHTSNTATNERNPAEPATRTRHVHRARSTERGDAPTRPCALHASPQYAGSRGTDLEHMQPRASTQGLLTRTIRAPSSRHLSLPRPVAVRVANQPRTPLSQ